MEGLRNFLEKEQCNPLTNKPILLARDTSYPDQTSEDGIILLLPLRSETLYAFIQPYIDVSTDMIAHVIKIASIKNLELQDNNALYQVSIPMNNQESTRFCKGVRYVPFMTWYFDKKLNKKLYEAPKNPRHVVPMARKFDTDKLEYQNKSGLVELNYQRQMIDGVFESCVMIKCVKSSKGEKLPAKMVILLPGEWDFFHKYLKFVSDFYKLSEKQNSLEVTHQQMAVNGMKKALEAIRKRKQEEENVPPPSSPSSSVKRTKISSKKTGTKEKAANTKKDENWVNVADHPTVTSLSAKAIVKQTKSIMRKKKDDSTTDDIEEIVSSSEESDVVEKKSKNATNRKNDADNDEEDNNDDEDDNDNNTDDEEHENED